MNEALTSPLCLLHGVTDASSVGLVLERASAAGVDQIEVATVGDIAGLVSVHDEGLMASLSPEGMLEDPERAAQLAILHHKILASAVAVTDVVPIRLGSVFSSIESARGLLSRERQRFVPELVRLKNTLEMGIRLSVVDGDHAAPQSAGSGRSYLRQRAETRSNEASQRAERTKAMRMVLDRLAAHAVDAVKRGARVRDGEAAVLADVAFLIKRDMLEAFEAEARSLKQDCSGLGINVGCTGPWPAYSFISTGEESGASWATH